MSAFVSVVVPVRDGAAHLGEQLDALTAQRIDPAVVTGWEVLVADNGSADGTVDLALARRADFPTALRVLDASDRPGAAAARNAGALAALAGRGEETDVLGGTTSAEASAAAPRSGPRSEGEAPEHVLAFCDADDRVGPDWVSAAAAALGGDPEEPGAHDVVAGPLRLLTTAFDPDGPDLGRSALMRAGYGFSALSCNLAVRAALFRGVGGFDAGMPGYGGEDTEFSIRLNAAGARFGQDPGMVLFFRETEDFRTRLRKRWARDAAHVRIWARHPEVYPMQSRASWVPTELLTLPVALVAAWRAGGAAVVRDMLVSRGAHAGAWFRQVTDRKSSRPVLLPDLEMPTEY